MQVTFISGPLHGKHEERDETPERLWVPDPNGGQFLYSRRQEFLEGVGNREMIPQRYIYGPPNMPMDEFMRLAREVEEQPE